MTTEEMFVEKWKELESATRLSFPTWDGRDIECFLKKMRVEGVDFTRIMALRNVRNVLSHNTKLNDKPLVALNSDVVSFLEDVIARIRQLPTVANIYIPKADVYYRAMDDAIQGVVVVMLEKVYSHVPVVDAHGRVVGVFSESTMLEVSNNKIGVDENTTLKMISRFLPCDRHTAEVFRFVPKNDSIAHIRHLCAEALQKHERIGMFFVTENGNANESLLGILTVWDVAGVSDLSRGSSSLESLKTLKGGFKMEANDTVMEVKLVDENTIVVGELNADGVFVEQYWAEKSQVDTHVKVLAWVKDLCTKRGVDIRVIQSFIECCEQMHPNLAVYNND
jgi:predicted transcriptional regulator